ncbi:MAG: hypothetical protein ACTSP9_14485, partial [Promethearchaeota archaeon]
MAKVIHISKQNVRDAWLSAVIQVLYDGDDIKTEYDKPDDPPSKDATVMIEIEEPLSNPISYEIYGCMADTYLIGSIQGGYIEEILEGVNDHYIWDSGTSFPYSYHDRVYNYAPFSLEDSIYVNYDLELVNNQFVKDHKKLKRAGKITSSKDSEIWKLKNLVEFDLNSKISDQAGINK